MTRTSSENPASPPSDSASRLTTAEDVISLWSKSEDVAMHFNDLLMGFRLKALGSISLTGGLAAAFLGRDTTLAHNGVLLTSILSFLLLVWTAIGLIDWFYYQRLLTGAVKSLTTFEKGYGYLTLSQSVEDCFPSKSRLSRMAFYFLPAAGLAAASLGVALHLCSWLSLGVAVAPILVIVVTVLVVRKYETG